MKTDLHFMKAAFYALLLFCSCHTYAADISWTAVPGNGWNPADPTSGNNWENQALFDYQNRALPAMSLFNQP